MSKKWKEKRKEKKRREWREVDTKNGIKYVKDVDPNAKRERRVKTICAVRKRTKTGGLGDEGFRPVVSYATID